MAQRTRDHYYDVVGKPTFMAPIAHAYSIDFTNKKAYRATANNSTNWVEVTDPNILASFFPPTVTPGTGSWPWQIITPNLYNTINQIWVLGSNSTQTVAQAGVNPAVYSGITVQSSDGYDWANLQYAIYLSKNTKRKIYLGGTFKPTKEVTIDWDHYALNIDGQDAWIDPVSTVGTALNRVKATSSTWAYMISNTKWHVENLNFQLEGSQVGMNVEMQNNSTFFNLKFIGGKLGINGNFWINTTCNTINLGEIATGIKLDAAEYVGAGTTATGNVKNSFLNIHYANATGTGEVALWLRACESTLIDGIISEGGHQKMGIYLDGASNGNFRICMIRNVYGEDCHSNQAPCTGAGEAMIVVRNWSSGIISVDGVKGLYGRILTDISTQGYLLVNISKIAWWERPSTGKMFITDPASLGLRYKLYDISHDYLPNPITNAFAGKSISAWWKTSATQDQPINTVVVY